MTLAKVALDDKYLADGGAVFISAAQALVRIPLAQKRRDLRAGLNTAGFISGYRGSPLGTFDLNLTRAQSLLAQHDVVFRAGVNEELAATSVYGSQQFDMFGPATRDGVFAMWYGKGPGVDRAGDALKHGALAGAHAKGGVLVLAGDDHSGKSSTTAHQSEQALIAAMIPVLYPASVQEYLDYGAFGFALSRYSGLWAGFKCVNDTADATATARVREGIDWIIPDDFEMPPGGLNIRKGMSPLQQEELLVGHRLAAGQAFLRANRMDQVVVEGPRRELGIIAAGKAYLDVMEALEALGLTDARLRALGIGVYKLAMTWPVEPVGARAFCAGYRQVLVVEEKRALIEPQIKDLLFNLAAAQRPAVIGKTDIDGAPLMSSSGEFDAEACARAILSVLRRMGLADEALAARVEQLGPRLDIAPRAAITEVARPAFFCSGCPHNTSTKLPAGAQAMAGIGCHVMAVSMADRPHAWPVQMGGEGANWIGVAPFTTAPHIFQNLGDGTYFHSGFLAIRASVAARTSITYKLLVNDAVAMTGGQPVEGQLSVAQMAHELTQEGVARVVVVADDVSRYGGEAGLPTGVAVRPRVEMDVIQTELQAVPGVTVLIYDQVCAAEKRRRRKTGETPEAEKRVFINDLVCEGCGDCSKKSNCVSVLPLETEFGRKRQIDQSNCNKDYSCVQGFCPSFVTVIGGSLKRRAGAGGGFEIPALPQPVVAGLDGACSVMITGIGGTGVVTIGAILGMAAHLEGKASSIMDMIGVSQKNGAVLSHVKIAARQGDIRAARISPDSADVLLACDLVVAGGAAAVGTLNPSRTAAVINVHETPTAGFQLNPDMDFQGRRTARRLRSLTVARRSTFADVSAVAVKLIGDSIATNMIMVGLALQKGLLPLTLDAVDRAIELNGVQVAANRRALALGRWLAVDPAAVEALMSPPEPSAGRERLGSLEVSETLEEMQERRVAFLTAYQDVAWAERYRDLIGRTEAAERAVTSGALALTQAVSRHTFKLMAYKDEYEVARLYADGAFKAKLAQQFEGDYRLAFHMAPPIFAPRNRVTGAPEKRTFGGWMLPVLAVLARFKGLRGSRLDPFGWSQERRTERALIEDYHAVVLDLIGGLTAANLATAVEVASYPDRIRGYGHVKAASLVEATQVRDAALARFRGAATPVKLAV